MITFKEYILEGSRRGIRLYNAGLKQSRIEQDAKNTFHDIMGSSPEQRIMSDLNDRPGKSKEYFEKGDKEVLKMMARSARKPKDDMRGTYSILDTLEGGSRNPATLIPSLKKIRSRIDLIKAGDRGEYGTLIPEI